MEKKHESPPGNFCSMIPIMHDIDSYSARSKYHLTIKNPCIYAFLQSPIFGVWLPDDGVHGTFNNISANVDCPLTNQSSQIQRDSATLSS